VGTLLVMLGLLGSSGPGQEPKPLPHLEVNGAALVNEVVVSAPEAPQQPNVLTEPVTSQPADLAALTGGLLIREDRQEPARAEGQEEQRVQTNEALSPR